MPLPVIESLTSERLTLEALSVDHAAAMVDVLADPALYTFTGGEAPSLATLTARYRSQLRGPADGSEAWLNWMVRRHDTDTLIGFVQATVRAADEGDVDEAMLAEIAWVIDPTHQRLGFAAEAAGRMVTWLQANGVERFAASIHPEHTASQRVAQRQGLRPTATIEDGEVRWESSAPEARR
ncbi:GNAT family N-acetyltransferase [Plantibacter sp. VKM Ac-2880]|uniref:GNAT family N-acetyltransferase n=1 Tax=Plantibacter sp. VKM Ac-2880 TaxID=2783827 RepID=UPI00189012C2|nr:GNAT family N-acetyltransferase [Plantibacter sp. VKM Ac-2880]MBF4567755.1 GNAT family N-acetyltransferase [Plantibacter sp. VKM Ac-2880]